MKEQTVGVPDEREAFEAKFPVPSHCIRVGSTYAATNFNAWAAQAYGDVRKGWLAALEYLAGSVDTAPTPPAQQSQWVPVSERLPNPEEHPRVLIYTDGVDFQGEQFFDVRAEQLNESYYKTPDDQPEVCQHATHWSPLPSPACPHGKGFHCKTCWPKGGA